ncbi:MAG TPA: hypothetical protein VGR97_02425 [Candidatus Acidoferrales bacterium]|nr:hypothetical protein [Candidatus Acidoferrales bacterium]
MRHRIQRPFILSLLFAAAILVPIPSWSQTRTVAGDFVIEPPTLVSLGFQWRISGDDNRNARVDVTYRKKGERQWRKGLPLLRLQREQVSGGAPRDGGIHYFNYVAPNMFAGSLLNLEPNTEYECRFVLTDPDGVKGKAERTVVVRTRKEPQPAEDGRVYHVYPFGYKGAKQQPAFTGLLAAYYMGSDESDHSNVMPPRVRAGDIILVHAGLYKDSRFIYSGFDRTIAAYGTPFDGTYYLTQSGTPEKPIVIKGAGDGEVIFDGDGCQNLFNLMAANYNYFEGITVRNTNVAFLLGYKNIAGSSGFTLKHSRLENIGRGVEDDWSGSKNFYIADNVFIGRHDPQKLQSWWTPAVWAKFPGYPAPITSEYAVKIYGQGHVVAYNYVANWHDGIDIATYGDPDGTPNELSDRVPIDIDFYGNDLYNMADNCIEADGGAHNIRVFRNRCFNSAGGALSAQPTFGGPLYFYQNLVYDATTGGPLKLIDTPAGVLIYQNTFFGQGRLMGPASNIHFLNNLILGDGWADPILNLRTYTNYSSSDYNGFRPNPNVVNAFEWTSPAVEVAADYQGKLLTHNFKSLKEYSEATKQDQHSVLLDYDVFVKAKIPDKSDPQRLYNPEDFDFRLKPGSAAVDAGILLPTINDDFTGKAPDLGAYELDRPLPHYGPRSWPVSAPDSSAPRSVTGPPRTHEPAK